MNDGTGGSCSSDPVGTSVQVVGVLKEEEEDFAMLGKVPLDEEGFVVSFSSEQTEEYLAFFQRWGFIVVSDALTEEQCHETLEEMWGDIERPEHTLDLTEWEGERPDIANLKSYFLDLLEKGVTSSQQQQAQPQNNQEEPYVLRWHQTGESTVRLHISRHHPITWATQLWPGIPHLGIIQSHGWANGAVAWRNRQLEKLHGVFSALAGTPRLLVTADRYGFMRPTRGEGCHESWATTARWLHWDMNPWDGDWSLYGFDAPTKELPCVRLQGLLNITEAREEDGGFYTVPGCSHHTLQWASHRPHLRQQYTNRNFVPVPREDTALYPRVQQIPARAGSLIVWNSLQAHSNHPNSSSRPRAVQYLTMVDADVGMTRQLPFEQVLPPAFQPTPLGRKLLSLDPWTPPLDPSVFSSCDII